MSASHTAHISVSLDVGFHAGNNTWSNFTAYDGLS